MKTLHDYITAIEHAEDIEEGMEAFDGLMHKDMADELSLPRLNAWFGENENDD